MRASMAFSMSGPAAAPVSVFTLNPLSIHGLWLAVMTMPAFAFLRIVAHENDWVGDAVVARWTGTPCAHTRTASYVYSSAMRARQPSVPKTILGMWRKPPLGADDRSVAR